MQQSGKYKLANWNFANLRDTMNTSCDIELLQACRDEYLRRMRGYSAWKTKQARKSLVVYFHS